MAVPCLLACACALTTDPGLDESYGLADQVTLIIVAEYDQPLLDKFKTLPSSQNDVRIVGDQWGPPPLYEDPNQAYAARMERRAQFQQAVRDQFEALNEPGRPVSVVISGHSMGYDFWGSNGKLTSRAVSIAESNPLVLEELAREYPIAFNRVRHVYLLGCNTGRELNLDAWKVVFPRAVTLLGFWQSGSLGTSAWTIYLGSRAYLDDLSEADVGDGEAVRYWLQGDPEACKKHADKNKDVGSSKCWSFVGLKAYELVRPDFGPDTGEPIEVGHYMVSIESYFGGSQEAYEGLSYDQYIHNQLTYERYFLAEPGYRDTRNSGSSAGPIREYYNGVWGLADVWCRRNANDPNCHWMQREVESSQRLNHFEYVKNWWLSVNYWMVEGIRAGLASELSQAQTRGEVLDLVAALAPEECAMSAALGVHTKIVERGPRTAPLHRLADALCGLSQHEINDTTAVTWESGLVIPPQP